MIGRGTGRHRPVRPSPATCPLWLRRALLVGTAGAGLWLAGSLGHAGSAEASPLPPSPGGLARVTQQLPSLAPDRPPARTIAGPHSPAGTLLRTAPGTALRSAGGQALTGVVPVAVGTATQTPGSPAVLPGRLLPVTALPVTPLPLAALPPLPTVRPLTLPLLGEPLALAGLISTPDRPALGRQLPFGPVLLRCSACTAVPAPSGATRQDRSPVRAELPSTPRPLSTMPVGTPPGGGTAGSSVAAMALLAPDSCRDGSPVGPPSRLDRRTPATRERASAPVVWPG